MPHLHAFAFALGLLVFLATLPGTLEIFFLTVGAGLKSKRSASHRSRNCRLAVVIPAHNEAGAIQRCIASIAASVPALGRDEIVVVADNCTDETAVLAAEAGARVLVRQDTTRRGKGYALRFAFDRLQATGFNQFLVIDADSVVSPNLVSEVSERLTAGAAAVQCRYRVAGRTASPRARLMDAAFLAFNVLRPKGRSGWGVSAGIQGNGFGLRAETLQKVPYNAASIVEDLEYHLRLVASSEKVEFMDAATVYGEIPAGGDAARAQRSRWEGGRLRMAREWVPQLVAGVARGQWRLLEPLFDLLTLSLAYQVLLLLVALATPFQAYAIAALGLVVIHVLCAALLGEHPWRTMAALATAPFYILWKVTTLNSVISASRRGANWVRTGRDNEAGLKLVK
jgi:cellulose synthase/poly-beta-1,6-N-acetylglucosamine synthase-like glycosyltransferase